MEQRSNCPHCSDTKQRFYERDTGSGTVQYCHNCGYKNFIPTKNRTPLETAKYIQRITTEKEQLDLVKDIRLPRDFSNNIPRLALVWLRKYGITDYEISSFGIGWSEHYQRLILPVYQNAKLVYYQSRTFKPITKDNPKYLNIKQSGAKNIFFTRGWDMTKPIDSLCIVEDILSAIKVGRYMPTLALLGSYFPVELNPLYRLCNKVLIWLDMDKYKEAIAQATKINAISGKPVYVISTPLDPKENKDDDIKHKIIQ